jgi:hypothetical protein
MHLYAAHRQRPSHAPRGKTLCTIRTLRRCARPSASRRADAVRISCDTISCAAKRDGCETRRPSGGTNACAPRGAHRVTSRRAGQGRLTGEDCFGPFGCAMTDGAAPPRRTAPRRPDGWGRASPASAPSPSHATQSPQQRNETFVRHCGDRHPPPRLPPTHANRQPGRCFAASSLTRMIEASRFPLAHPAFPSNRGRHE